MNDRYSQRLTPFEHYMLCDDRAKYPMTFVGQMDFLGSIRRKDWEWAFLKALERHPLLTSIVVSKRFWQRTPLRPELKWINKSEECTPENGEYLDLSQQPGIRAWMYEGEGQISLRVQFHHACCDGIGSLQFMGDWLALYHGRCCKEEIALKPLNDQGLILRGRSRWKSGAEVPLSRWQATKSHIKEIIKFSTRHLTPLHGKASSAPQPFPGFLQHTFTKQVTRQLRLVAKEKGATLNDLILRDLFLAITEWNSEPIHSKKWLQINMPTSLRGRGDFDLPAANMIGYAFLARQVKDCQDDEQLLQSIQVETTTIRKWNLGQFFLDAIERIQKVPGAMRWFVSPRSCYATTVFSNLGDFKRHFHYKFPHKEGRLLIGDLALQRFLATPPLRPFTKAVFLASLYAGELTIIMRGDARALGKENAKKLLQQLVTHLERSAEASKTAGDTPSV